MFRKFGGITVALLAGLLAGGVVGVGCGQQGDGSCVTDSECTGGETCVKGATDAVGSCGCTPGGTQDQCTKADAATVCHPDEKRCTKACTADSECLSSEKCDPATKSCRDASKLQPTDCTQQGQECASDKVCNPATKACVAPCDASSCTGGQVCNTATKLCEADCTASGATCPSGKVCDQAAKVCVAACGEGTCQVDEACGADGKCVKRCDAPGGAECKASDSLVCNPQSGLCQLFCDDVSAPSCAEGTVCSAGTHLCVDKCTSDQNCSGGQGFCRKDTGLCETRVQISDCQQPATAENRTYANPETNRCEPASELSANCARAAGRDAANTDVPQGPTAFNAQFSRYENASDSACTGKRAIVQVGYYDFESDFPIDASSQLSALNNAVRVAIGTTSTGTDDQFANNTPHVVPGSTAQTGVLEFSLCRGSKTTPEDFAIYLRDAKGHFGNTICFTVPAP